MSHARGSDLPLAWDPAPGTVAVVLSASSEQLVCKFPASSGGDVVPGALLGRFAGTQLLGQVMGWSEATVSAGDWPVALSAAAMAVDRTSGDAASFTVHLQ